MKKLVISVIVFICSWPGYAGSPEKVQDLLKNEIKLKLNENGTAWTKLSIAAQFWGRYSELNPGSTNKAGDPVFRKLNSPYVVPAL